MYQKARITGNMFVSSRAVTIDLPLVTPVSSPSNIATTTGSQVLGRIFLRGYEEMSEQGENMVGTLPVAVIRHHHVQRAVVEVEGSFREEAIERPKRYKDGATNRLSSPRVIRHCHSSSSGNAA